MLSLTRVAVDQSCPIGNFSTPRKTSEHPKSWHVTFTICASLRPHQYDYSSEVGLSESKHVVHIAKPVRILTALPVICNHPSATANDRMRRALYACIANIVLIGLSLAGRDYT